MLFGLRPWAIEGIVILIWLRSAKILSPPVNLGGAFYSGKFRRGFLCC